VISEFYVIELASYNQVNSHVLCSQEENCRFYESCQLNYIYYASCSNFTLL